MPSLITALREFICFHQKQTIKYEYLIAERHKNLKYLYHQKHAQDELKKLYNEFIIHSYGDLLKVLESNQKYIYNIFRALDKQSFPRITIKTIHGDDVLNIYRSTKATNFSITKIEKNTGFYEILYNNRLSYLENNLPDQFKALKYKNPRLNEEKRQVFNNGSISWKECWMDDNDKDVEYYSSTLIIPMSIRSDESDKNDQLFYNHFFSEVEQSRDSRTIWGFLCFDDIDTNYFQNSKNDNFEEVGYIIADILSFYLMYFYNHISGSTTVKEIEKVLFPIKLDI